MPKKAVAYDFIVEARRRTFPIDMLRYDRCMPITSEDVEEITNNLRYAGCEDDRLFSIKLRTYTSSGVKHPTFDRWRSFGWSVREGSITPVGI
jgi:hypothetical protein